MDLNTRKSVFGDSDQVGLKLACSATETSQNIEFSHVASLEIILSTEQMGPDARKFCLQGFANNKGTFVIRLFESSIF